jgi:hypothetical protein
MGDMRVHFPAFLRKRGSADDGSQSERVDALPAQAVRIVGGWCALARCRPVVNSGPGWHGLCPYANAHSPAVPGRGELQRGYAHSLTLMSSTGQACFPQPSRGP